MGLVPNVGEVSILMHFCIFVIIYCHLFSLHKAILFFSLQDVMIKSAVHFIVQIMQILD